MNTCQRCGQPGVAWLEPAGVWCPAHKPILWRLTDHPSPWATPRCHCGRPAAYPNHNNTITRPVCRDHAPQWMLRYLIRKDTP